MGLSIASISDDKARCVGEDCPTRETCMRYKQIKHDPVRQSNRPLLYVRSLRDSEGECHMRIELG
jgi:hypothetical protein